MKTETERLALLTAVLVDLTQFLEGLCQSKAQLPDSFEELIRMHLAAADGAAGSVVPGGISNVLHAPMASGSEVGLEQLEQSQDVRGGGL